MNTRSFVSFSSYYIFVGFIYIGKHNVQCDECYDNDTNYILVLHGNIDQILLNTFMD